LEGRSKGDVSSHQAPQYLGGLGMMPIMMMGETAKDLPHGSVPKYVKGE